MRLTIIRIKPNPAGRDRAAQGGPTPTQLAGEWVDIRNDAGQDLSLNGISLWHLAYKAGGNPDWQRVTNFTFMLPAEKIVRIHSGRERPLSVVSPEDLSGADYHAFTGDDSYVWNNKQGDTPLLFREAARETVDKASYGPNPPEGVVLVRQSDQLVAMLRAASW